MDKLWRFFLIVCKIRQGNAGKLGAYEFLSVLPDKFARFLFEFESLDLPFLPADISDFDVKERSYAIRAWFG